jgi:hypothetical protein
MENNEVEKNSGERRFARRYETKDVLVYIRYLKKINWLNRFTGPCILDSKFMVKGKIIGKKADLFENKYEYVVQFNPYGKGLKYNSFQSKEKLERFFEAIESDENF